MLNTRERTVLRDLATRVREIADDPVQEKNIGRWRDLNALRKVRPLIQCAPPMEVWPELLPESELVIGRPSGHADERRLDAVDTFKKEDNENAFFRAVEADLRRRIYRWEHIRDDEVITADLYIPSSHRFTDWMEGRERPYSGQADRAGEFVPCIVEHDDLKKLRFPELVIDEGAEARQFQAAQETLGGLLHVQLGCPYQAGIYHAPLGWGASAMDVLCEMRGLEQIYNDFCLNPSFVHEAMDFLTRGILDAFDQLERAGLLRLNDNETVVGPCGPGYSDEVPPAKKEGAPVRTQDLWGFSQTQELAGVGPEMLSEFVLPYQARMAERFALNCYGCCEANDLKWEAIKSHIPNLRGLSVSPWAKHELAVEALGDQYIYSWKPHPAKMIGTFDETYIRREIERVFELTKECRVAVSLRDVQTVYGEPDRLSKWTRIAKEVAAQYN